MFKHALFAGVLFALAPLPYAAADASEGATPPNAAPFQWVSIGPTSIAPTNGGYDTTESTGRVSSIVVVPPVSTSSPTAIIAASANGGVWEATTSSAGWNQWTWSPLTDGLRDLAFGAVAVFPSNPQIIYAGTGEDHGSCLDCAVGEDLYKSTDGGTTWVTLTPLPGSAATGMQTSSIVVDPTNSLIVWVGGTLGVYRSVDGGSTWATIATPDVTLQAPIIDLKLDPSDPTVAYFTDRRHIWKYSVATGASVDVSVKVLNFFEQEYPSTTFAISIAIAPRNHSVLYASYAYTGAYNEGCLAGLYRSSDAGATWNPITVQSGNDYLSSAFAYNTGGPGCQGWYDQALAVDPLDADHLVAAGEALADFNLMTPSGFSLTSPVETNLSAVSNVHPDHHALAFDAAGNLYDGNDGGVWMFPHAAFAANSNVAGQNISRGLDVTQFSPGGTWLADGSFFAGSQDNGTEVYSLSSGVWSWRRLAPGDGGYTASDPGNADVLYHEYFWGNMELSTDHGAHWVKVAPPYGNVATVSWVMPFIMDPANPLLMFSGSNVVWRTTTGGLFPNPTSPNWDWLRTAPTGFYKITSIDEKPGEDQLIVGDDSGDFAYTFDHGATPWRGENVNVHGKITVVKLDPYTPGALLVGYRDTTQPFAAHLLRITTAPGGPTVQTAWDSGMNAPVDSLLFGPGVLIAGTDRGIFTRALVGGAWSQQLSTPGAPAIPSVPVVDLKPAANGSAIVALTHGRGAWLSNDPKYLAPNDSTIGFTGFPPSGRLASSPSAVAVGPDGAVWFTEFKPGGSSAIGRTTTGGSTTEFAVPNNGFARWIVAGPDGALWFTDSRANRIGRITTAGVITEYAVPTAGSVPNGIAAGADGALWFTEQSGNQVGRIPTSATPANPGITEFPLPRSQSAPMGITSGPDGALWFAEYNRSSIGRIPTSATTANPSITEYSIPRSGVQEIVAGSDGALWFAELNAGKIGRIPVSATPANPNIKEYALPNAGSNPGPQPWDITTGPDGALWFTELAAGKVGRITTAGIITEYATPGSASPQGIVAGPDGGLWFGASSPRNQLMRLGFP
jgi:virginiamycin B lyase